MKYFIWVILGGIAAYLVYSNWDKIKENLPDGMKPKKEDEKPLNEATVQVQPDALVNSTNTTVVS